MSSKFKKGEEQCSYMQSFLKSPIRDILEFIESPSLERLVRNFVNIINQLMELTYNILYGILNPFKFYQEIPCLFMSLISTFSFLTLSIMKSKPDKSDTLTALFITTISLISVNLIARLKFDIMPVIYNRKPKKASKYGINFQNPIYSGEDLENYEYFKEDTKEEPFIGSEFKNKSNSKRKENLYVKILNTLILISLLIILILNFYFIYTDQKSKTVNNFAFIGIGIAVFSFLIVYYRDVMSIVQTLVVHLLKIFSNFYKVFTGKEKRKNYDYKYTNPLFKGNYDKDIGFDAGNYDYDPDRIERERIAELSASSNIFDPSTRNPIYQEFIGANEFYNDLESPTTNDINTSSGF